jgi:hypothetical protein
VVGFLGGVGPVQLLRRSAEEAGRDPSAVAITAWPGRFDVRREFVGRYVKAGANRLLMNPRIRTHDDLPMFAEQLARYRK